MSLIQNAIKRKENITIAPVSTYVKYRVATRVIYNSVVENYPGGKKQSKVEKWLNSLTTDQLKSVAKEVRLLEKCGNELRLPHSKSLGNGLFELRERKYGFRIYYCFLRGKTILLLLGGDKSTQTNDIQSARRILAKVTYN